MFWRALTHHSLKTVLRLVQLLLFVVLPGVLFWLHFAGLPRALHEPLVEAARREGLDIGFTRMRLSFLQGLVLDGVKMRAERLPEAPEVAMDRAAISLDWRALLRGRVVLTSLDLRGAQLFLPVSSEGGVTRTLRLTKARARLMLADGVVGVPLARFNLQGVEVIASGQIVLGGGEAPSAPTGLVPPEVSRALEVLESLDFGRTPPVLELEFAAKSGDAAALQLPRIQLEAPSAAYGRGRLEDIRLDASYARSVLEIHNLSARDRSGGALDLQGTWNLAGGAAQAEAQSTLDPAPWLTELRPQGPWRDLSFGDSPAVQASLELRPGENPRLRVIGTVDTGRFSFRGANFRGLSGGFAWRDGELYTSDVLIRPPSGEIRGDVMMRPEDVKIRVDCRADPLQLLPLLPPKAQEDVRKMELTFTDTPEIRMEGSGTALDPAKLAARGTLKLGRTAIHGSPLDRATADVAFENLALIFTGIEVTRPEGTGSGSFVYDFGQKQVRLDGIRSTMNPLNVLQWADPNVARETEPYRFKAPPEVTVNGVIGLKNPELTRLRADFTAPRGLDYDLLGETLEFGATEGKLEFAGRKITVDIPSARLFGGQARIDATITTGQPGARQKMGVVLEKVDFETLTRLYFAYEDSQGVLDARYDFTFVPGKPELMRGQGSLLVANGNVFAIPVLGPLSVLLDSVIPGTGYQTSRRATCDFRVSDGVIRTDNLDVEGQGFSMIGQGDLFFLEDRMDFTVRVNARGVPGVLLYPVSKLFEYIADGKLSEPKWRPRVLPKGPGRGAGTGLETEPADKTKPVPEKGPAPRPGEPSAGAKPNGRA
jgi:hypothetical protein